MIRLDNFCGTQKGSVFVIDARVKIIILFLFSICLFLSSAAWTLIPWAGVLAASLAVAQVRMRTVLRAVAPVAIILVGTMLANAIVISGDATVLLFGPVGLSAQGAVRGGIAVSRIVMMAGFACAFSVSTQATEIADACVRLLRPCAVLGVPVADIGLALSIALRFIPIVSEELHRIRLAQRARGARFDQGGALQQLSQWAGVFTPLLVGMLRRADTLGASMEARCYGMSEVSIAPLPLTVRDKCVLGGAVVLCVCVVGAGWMFA